MKIVFKNAAFFLLLTMMISADTAQIHKLFVIGDSTASIYAESYHPRTGWGQILQAFFDSDKIHVVDKALSGRSSKSYYSDPNGWVTVLNDLSEGDYLFIQFGHNDQKSDERHTDPYTTYQEYLSIYIDSARARGAYPVLLTSIHRNKWSGTSINDSHGDYPPAMRALAIEKNVPLIDLHDKTKTLFESLGQEYTTNQIFMNLPDSVWVNYPSGNEDNTHLQEYGAYEVCQLVCEEISDLKALGEMKILDEALVLAGRLIATSNPNLAANITGKGVYPIGAEVTLEAMVRNGYQFENWFEADTLLSESKSLTIFLNDSVRSVKANFIKTYRVSLKQASVRHGILQGDGYYAPGIEVSIIATPKAGYRFLNWEKDDEEVTSDSIYTFTIGDSDISFNANFEELPVSLFDKDFPAEGIMIYPNPASEFVTFSVQTESPEHIVLSIIDLEGRLVFQSFIENRVLGEKRINLSLSDIPNGLYTCQFTNKVDVMEIHRFIVQH